MCATMFKAFWEQHWMRVTCIHLLFSVRVKCYQRFALHSKSFRRKAFSAWRVPNKICILCAAIRLSTHTTNSKQHHEQKSINIFMSLNSSAKRRITGSVLNGRYAQGSAAMVVQSPNVIMRMHENISTIRRTLCERLPNEADTRMHPRLRFSLI